MRTSAGPEQLGGAGPRAALDAVEPLDAVDQVDLVDLTVVIPALDEADNLALLLPRLREVLDGLSLRYEVLIVTRPCDPATAAVAESGGARLVEQRQPGYGSATLEGLAAARGTYVLTMDADLSHAPTFVADMWRHREEADITIASRWVEGGRARMPLVRRVLSRVLNAFFTKALAVPVRDLSSGFRLYRKAALRGHVFKARKFDILQEILVRAYSEGWVVRELPFEYQPRAHGSSHARVWRLGVAYCRTFWPLWALRNSIRASDYDDRAYDSPVPLQRYWQRARFRHVTELIGGHGAVLDVGCGSSRILGALPPGSVGVDILVHKLRYARRFGVPLVNASGLQLPFRDASFPCVLSSEVIEHVPKDAPMLEELVRMVAPGGWLVIGTPDYSRREWVYTEKVYARVFPGGYVHEHIAQYTHDELVALLAPRGLRHRATRYILRAEMILAFSRDGDVPG